MNTYAGEFVQVRRGLPSNGRCRGGKNAGPGRQRYNGALATMPSRPHRQSIPGEGMMVQLKRNLLSVALASATLMMIATAAHAQSADQQATTQADQQQAEQDEEQDEKQDPKTLDTVTVVGIRAGIEDAIQTKKDSTSIVESISAEDIGKL